MKKRQTKKERASPLEIKVLWGDIGVDRCAADEGKDDPCCALAVHLLVSGPRLLLFCHTAHRLAQHTMGSTRRERERERVKTA